MTWLTLARNFGVVSLALLVSACGQQPSTSGNNSSDVQASPPGAAQCVTTTAAELAAGVSATNNARRRANLPSVAPNAILAQAAARHACDMAKRGRMTHVGSSTSGPGQRVKKLGYAPRVTAENIAAGPFSINRVLAEWNASSGHLSNIMIPQMRHYGIGHAVGSDGRTQYWAAVYAAPKTR